MIKKMTRNQEIEAQKYWKILVKFHDQYKRKKSYNSANYSRFATKNIKYGAPSVAEIKRIFGSVEELYVHLRIKLSLEIPVYIPDYLAVPPCPSSSTACIWVDGKKINDPNKLSMIGYGIISSSSQHPRL